MQNSLVDIAQDIMADLSGGKLGDKSRFTEDMVMDKIRTWRAWFINNNWQKSKYKEYEVEGLQEFRPKYDRTIQDALKRYIKFPIPSIVAMDKSAGLRFVGGPEGEISISKSILECGRQANMKLLRENKATFRTACIDNGYLLVFGLGVEGAMNLKVKAIFEDPLDVPIYTDTYNYAGIVVNTRPFDELNDKYPVPADLIPFIKMKVKEEMQISLSVKEDTTPDGALTPQIPTK